MTLKDETIVAATGLPVGTALSPSRASDFLTCPLLFRFRQIDRLPERPSSAAVRGTLVHAVLEDLYDLPAAERTVESARSMLLPTWHRLLAEDPRLAVALDPEADFPLADNNVAPVLTDGQLATWITAAEPLIESYFELENPQRLEPRAREMRVEVQLEGGPPLRGIIDRVDVAPDERVRVVDYKTGRSPGQGFEQRSLFQMRFYALMLWRLNGTIPSRLQLIYLGDSQVLTYDPTEDELVSFEKTLRALWTTITRVAAQGNWQAKESRLCGWCDHHAKCPAKGGTPPPLPIDLTSR
ncbi:MAG: PD-(D/E)XK nuclease family protein [Candidatus Nanopelagicales bacterium]